MDKQWSRRSALLLMGSGAGLQVWGTGGFTNVTAVRTTELDTEPDPDALLGIDTSTSDDSVTDGETATLLTIENNTGPQTGTQKVEFDPIKISVTNESNLDFDVDLDSSSSTSLSAGDTTDITAEISECGSGVSDTIELEIVAEQQAENASSPNPLTISTSTTIAITCEDEAIQCPVNLSVKSGVDNTNQNGSNIEITGNVGNDSTPVESDKNIKIFQGNKNKTYKIDGDLDADKQITNFSGVKISGNVKANKIVGARGGGTEAVIGGDLLIDNKLQNVRDIIVCGTIDVGDEITVNGELTADCVIADSVQTKNGTINADVCANTITGKNNINGQVQTGNCENFCE